MPPLRACEPLETCVPLRYSWKLVLTHLGGWKGEGDPFQQESDKHIPCQTLSCRSASFKGKSEFDYRFLIHSSLVKFSRDLSANNPFSTPTAGCASNPGRD